MNATADSVGQQKMLHALGQMDCQGKHKHLCWLVDPVLETHSKRHKETEGLKVQPVPFRHSNVSREHAPQLLFSDSAEPLLKMASPMFTFALQEAIQVLPPSCPRPRTVCALIASDLPALQLSELLGELATAVDNSGNRRIVRFWDPRVLQHVRKEDAAFAPMFAALEGLWTFVDGLGRLKQIEFVSRAAMVGGANIKMISDHQLQSLHRISDVNAVFERISGAWLGRDSREPWSFICAGLDAAVATGLRRSGDRIVFAALRTELHLPVERSEVMKALLAAVESTGASLSSLWAELSDRDRELLVREATVAQEVRAA